LEGNTQNVTTLEVDTDGDGNPDAIKSVGVSTTVGGVNENGTANTNAGTLTQNANGSYTFIPTAGFVGTVTYEYTVCDDVSPQACEIATAKIDVLPESSTSNTDVTASPDSYETEQNTSITSTLFSNDNDPEGGSFKVTSGIYDTNGDGTLDGTLVIAGAPVTVGGFDEDGNTVTNAGTLTIDSTGIFIFAPATGFSSVRLKYEFVS
jgi:hypothetical protein